ncbi:aminotransferase class I/II-fold pyridoxal phosphate-dependent enzyme [Roseomonas genomospecies 6]|uniref:Aminotransferase class I/II-fold pyridoxal phosphate-dependent enzyme n=1 Tax=Roseomonas genomospecies 6 TaxID=214106 RepID=A0A9W7KMK3_9PROT|nr:aminotransferase class I/II-fold pyridoxal phosphate-dependent enzyme [Roseomonas genomospecies 6]KAA0675636.1 aminotransferase class I/II-fold pyridoxal phosphate-dependent enzyme [Roseomonas genomospecies 6]
MSNQNTLSTAEILNLYKELEIVHGDGDAGAFLFGWQCRNPFSGDLIEATIARSKSYDYVPYAYMEDDRDLSNKVKDMHACFGERAPEHVFCASSGASSVLFTFCAWLSKSGIKEVYYIPPIYFTMLNALHLFGIRARPISARHAFESDFTLNLPAKESVLILADPVWYVGIPIKEETINELVAWQKNTGSFIFVDGSFQYMPWDGHISEPTSNFDPSRTIRLVSPTKSLAVNGYRFAYATIPVNLSSEFKNLYTNIYGSGPTDNIAFAYEAIEAMKARSLTDKLIGSAKDRHVELRSRGVISSPFNPRCGYFAYEQLNYKLPDGYIKMDGKYFGQFRFPDHVRINLLSPSQNVIQ